MTFNSEAIIQDIRTDFEQMLAFVMGPKAQTATADSMERGLFALLLKLGAKLLTLFFVLRSKTACRESLPGEAGRSWRYHRDTKRDYFSIFGKVEIHRPYFYRKGSGGQAPLDAELSLGEDCYSDLVREVSEYLAVYNVYGKTADILSYLLGIQLSTRALDENIATDATEVKAYYDQKPAPPPESEAPILVIQADGKGVPMILAEPAEKKIRLGKGEKRGQKKEAVVTTVYSIAPKPRTPEEVVASFFNQSDTEEKSVRQHIRPQNKQVWATLEGKDTALERLSRQVLRRQGNHIQSLVALCDGCEALQTRLASHFPDFTLVLDFIHADEYLWDAATCLFGEQNQRERLEWMQTRTLQILSGQTSSVIAELRRLSLAEKMKLYQRAQLTRSADYFERNLPFMDYPTYLANGWSIASGVIEGACRHFVKDRCELSGMRWSQAGVESLLALRAIAENGDWQAYHDFRRQQRHACLYPSPYPDHPAPEELALDLDHVDRAFSLIPVCEPGSTYQALPLAT